MFNFLSFLISLLHSIPFRHAIHFLACITLDLISLSSVLRVSKITHGLMQERNICVPLVLVSDGLFKVSPLPKLSSSPLFSPLLELTFWDYT
jgi:hypothetical protein